MVTLGILALFLSELIRNLPVILRKLRHFLNGRDTKYAILGMGFRPNGGPLGAVYV